MHYSEVFDKVPFVFRIIRDQPVECINNRRVRRAGREKVSWPVRVTRQQGHSSGDNNVVVTRWQLHTYLVKESLITKKFVAAAAFSLKCAPEHTVSTVFIYWRALPNSQLLDGETGAQHRCEYLESTNRALATG